MRLSTPSYLVCALLASSVTLAGCDTNTFPDGYVAFLTAPNDDPWSPAPAVQHVQVDVVQGTDHETVADVSAPPDTASVGNQGPRDVTIHFEATGFTASGDAVVTGVSPSFPLFGFSGMYLPLFVARRGEFATAPAQLVFPHVHPIAVIDSLAAVSMVAGGEDASFDLYDPLTWTSPTNQTPLPQTVKSLAMVSVDATTTTTTTTSLISRLLMINDDGANWLDFTVKPAAASPASGPLIFADISGGQTLVASDNTTYIVGATRSDGKPTTKVLQIDAQGALKAFTLNTARLGAAAALVDDALLVVGGSDTGSGAELLAVGAKDFSELPYPADETTGAGLVELTSTSVLLAGGHDANGDPSVTRTLDLSCSDGCSAAEFKSAKFSIGRSQAYRLADNQALIVGETDDTQTHAYFVDATGSEPVITEKALSTPRKQASSALLPNGQVAIFGGSDLDSGDSTLNVDVFFQ